MCSSFLLREHSESDLSKRNSTSVVWDYFGFKKEDVAQCQVLCKTCLVIVATSQGNTTNLYQHLKAHHKALYDRCIAKKTSSVQNNPSTRQGSVTEMFASVTPYERTSKRHVEITEAVAQCIAKDMMPVNTVTKPGLKNLVTTLDKRYSMPSRTYFSQIAIPELHRQSTTDMWSSRTAEPYQSLRVHYITEDLHLKARSLQTAYFPEDHTGENIAAGLREGLECWDLNEDNLVCITTDNASNMVKAAQLNEWTRLQCFGHRLHLAIGKLFCVCVCVSDLSRAIGLCKKLVGHFSHSWRKKAALTEAQKELKLPEHSLITECPTRWGSEEKMIARVLEQAKAISQVLSGDRHARFLIPTWQDTEVLESIHKALHPLSEFTDALSGEEYVSISYLKPVLHLLATSVLAEDAEDTDLTRSIKTKVLAYLNDKYSDLNTQELLDVASFMDPRFKTQYITNCKTNAKKCLGSLFKTSVTSSALPLPLEDAVEAELNSYLLTPVIDGEDDPLAWWKVHNIHFPRLCNIARKYLCVPATSAPSERLFSTGGNIVTCTRSSLKPAKVDMLVFLAKNLTPGKSFVTNTAAESSISCVDCHV
uniref:BED-type domain-containing protein n=1 Tax=Sander lucioperca TaxID=283035 RepID=A0A8C9YIK6_SANLU